MDRKGTGVPGKRSTRQKPPADRVTEAAISAEDVQEAFPSMDLPIQPPFPPMEAKSVAAIPEGERWSYEPKWDGFRCLAFRSGHTVALQSKAGQPLGRYFPELVEAFTKLPARYFVLDGEIVIESEGRLSFDALLMRIHPAESRIRKLSHETPATFLAFDILVEDVTVAKNEGSVSLINSPLSERRSHLEDFFRSVPKGSRIHLSPSSTDYQAAQKWMRDLAGSGFDGVVAKRLDEPYTSGERAMQKIKRIRAADCVVGGFRWASKGGEVGSLLLGLYDEDGLLHHVGFTSAFSVDQRKQLKQIVARYQGGSGFSGRAPGGPSRWSTERTGQWKPLDPKLVCEVQYDHFSGDRFRHGTRFLRWRPDKAPRQCTFEQVRGGGAVLQDVLRAA